MTDSLDAVAASLIAILRKISDPVERYQAAKKIGGWVSDEVKQVNADAAKELHEDRPWSEVGALLGVTGSRAEQISRASR